MLCTIKNGIQELDIRNMYNTTIKAQHHQILLSHKQYIERKCVYINHI